MRKRRDISIYVVVVHMCKYVVKLEALNFVSFSGVFLYKKDIT